MLFHSTRWANPFHLHNLTLHIIFSNTFHSCRVLGPSSHSSFPTWPVPSLQSPKARVGLESGLCRWLSARLGLGLGLGLNSGCVERRPEQTLIKAVVKQVCLIDRAYAKNKKRQKAQTKEKQGHVPEHRAAESPELKALILYRACASYGLRGELYSQRFVKCIFHFFKNYVFFNCCFFSI